MKSFICCILIHLNFLLPIAQADSARIATTDDFLNAALALKQQFEKITPYSLILVADTSEDLYQQIQQGEQFDVFMTDNAQHLKQLEQQGKAIPQSAFTYAIGELVLWSPDSNLIDSQGNVLLKKRFKKILIPNPKTSYYGQATQQTLQKLGLWQSLQSQIIQKSSVMEVYQAITAGKGQLGFIAVSQLTQLEPRLSRWSVWTIPRHLYSPIEHTVVPLNTAEQNPVAQEFINFLHRSLAHSILEEFGYTVP